ncbi:MAG: M50 family metallopeptidase [Actinomycetota bacterium]
MVDRAGITNGIPEGLQTGLLDRLPELNDMADGRLIQLFWAAVAISVILPRLPYGRLLLYPFALLGTWVHELGHGLTAIVVGGRFKRLEVHRNLDGLAFSSGLGGMGRAVVAAGGLLAPAVVGGLFIVLGSREATAPWILTGLAAAVLASVVFFVRNTFGWVALGLVGLALVPVAWRAPELIRVFVAQLVGIQFCVASWGSLNYMFTKNFVRNDGTLTDSDTQTIANVLLLPYWFWGGLIAAFSLAILAASFYLAWIYPT